MKVAAALLLCCTLISCSSAPLLAQSAASQNKVPLSDVLEQTKRALDDYARLTYERRTASCREFLPLSSANFNFKTVVDEKGGGSVKLFVVSLGATKDQQATTQVAFTYQPRVQPPLRRATRFSYYDQILATLKEVGATVAQANSEMTESGNLQLDLKEIDVTLDFAVTTDNNGGLSAPWSFVTLSGSLDKNSAASQEVKLIFKDDGKLPLCSAM